MASMPNVQKGRALYEKLGSPKTFLAPMVDASELAWRKLCRKYGADICYSPMYHARLFGTTESYRKQQLCDEDYTENDKPLVIQFCSNKPNELVDAVKLVKNKCDAVDLNLGCPQGIARKGHYGAFLMDEWELVASLIGAVNKEVPEVPITAKIRVFEDRQKTLAYAKSILQAGAWWLTVHGRTREMKGQQTGLADWSQIKFLRDELPSEVVLIANGNIIYKRNIEESINATGADAVMIAETALSYPAIFAKPAADEPSLDDFPRVDHVLREYFDIVKATDGHASVVSLKTHMFKLLRTFFIKEVEIRNKLGPLKSGELDKFEVIVKEIEDRVNHIVNSEPENDVITPNGDYLNVPYWRIQPLFRVVNGVASNGEVRSAEKAKKGSTTDSNDEKIEKRKASDDTAESSPEHKKPKMD